MPLGDLWFSDEFEPDFGLEYRPVLPREVLETWDNNRLFEYYRVRKERDEAALNNPIGDGWTLPMWTLVMKNWKKYQNIVILGGNRCLRGDSLIFDPVLGVSRRIDSIRGKHHVYSWSKDRLVIAEAEEPFQKPAGPMLRIRLSDGQEFVGAREHQVMLSSGAWLPLSSLQVGVALCHPRTTLDTCPVVPLRDDLHSSETLGDFRRGYRREPHLYDELLHEALGTFQGVFPSQVGAATHISVYENSAHLIASRAFDLQQRKLGVLGRILSRIPIVKRFYRLATWDDLQRLAALFVDRQCHFSYKPCKSILRLRENPGSLQASQQSTDGFYHHEYNPGFLQQGNQSSYVLAYVTQIEQAGIEVKWDMTVPAYGNYLQSGVIHHNSSKSMIASRLCVWAAGTIPQAEVRCYHVNDDRSREDQQRMIWDAIPISIKNLPTKKGQFHNLQWSQRNGFVGSECILPPIQGARRGGTIKFGNYRQYQQDAQVAEGFKSHVNWCDEECPQKFWETLQYRTIDYHGRNILTFTTLTGWTPTVQDILGKTRTLQKRFAPLVGRELPIMQESLSRPGTVIYYFWTEDNWFIDTSDFQVKIKGRSKDEILARAYGIPTKSVTSVFPGFVKEINVIEHEKLPWLKDPNYAVTRYMAVDPAGSKNWFMLWVAVDAAGTWWVYREWPDYDDWALPGNTLEGKPGPAQKGSKRGIKDYVELIRACENGEEIYERLIDPRLGAAEKQSQDGATTIISDLDDCDMTFIPAPGVEIENGLQLINNLLAYDESKPIDSLNAPKLYISDRCQNLIYAMQEYTAQGGRTENTKDPIDALRYLCCAGADFIDEVGNVSDRRSFSY